MHFYDEVHVSKACFRCAEQNISRTLVYTFFAGFAQNLYLVLRVLKMLQSFHLCNSVSRPQIVHHVAVIKKEFMECRMNTFTVKLD